MRSAFTCSRCGDFRPEGRPLCKLCTARPLPVVSPWRSAVIGLYVAPTLLWSVLAGALFTVRLFVNGMYDSPRMNPSESPLEWGHEDAPRWVLPLAPTAIQFLLAIPASVAVLSGPQVRPR